MNAISIGRRGQDRNDRVPENRTHNVLWLAEEDIRRRWQAYPGSALYLGATMFLLLGSSVMEIGSYSFEFVMLAIGYILATPFFASDYMSWSTDLIAERLGWLRTLPIGVPTIVRARALSIVAALPLNAIAFFAPVWFGGRWDMSAGTFLWFMLAMIGISIAGAGATLAFEMSIGIRRWIVINITTLVIGLASIILIGLVFDFRLFEQLSRAVAWNGPFVAGLCIAGGVVAFLGCVRLAERQLRRRELGS